MNTITRQHNIQVNRVIVITLLLCYFWQFSWQPTGIYWIADILLRTYILFLCEGVGHEATHGVLANSKKGNIWWGRFSFIPLIVPSVLFRITHRYHHLHTNDEKMDPDMFLKVDSFWDFITRAVAMPNYWIKWLKDRDLLTREVVIEVIVVNLCYIAIFGSLCYFAGWERVLMGIIPAQILNAFLLWYPFSVMAHEGRHTGDQEFRSHNYYGKTLYWVTMGLSLHRAHHLKPQLGWLQLKSNIQEGPLFKRDIKIPVKT